MKALHLQGAGEVLIDDIRLTSTDTPFFARFTRRQGEWIANGSFEYGLEIWPSLVLTSTATRLLMSLNMVGKISNWLPLAREIRDPTILIYRF